MHIETDFKLDFKDVLIKPKRSTLVSRNDVDLYRTFKFRYSPQAWQGIPLMASNMDSVGSFGVHQTLEQHGMLTCLHKHYTIDELKAYRESRERQNNAADSGFDYANSLILSIGAADKDFEYLQQAMAVYPDIKFICLDVANGYLETFLEAVKRVRRDYPSCVIIAGNVVTSEMTEALILAGADIVKVGIGPSAVCTTRMMTGVGVPQLSAIMECADAAHGLGGHIIGDGGCVVPGDIVKAFAAGADFVMLGSMLAGHTQCEGELIEEDGHQFKLFYGMSSSLANHKHAGGLKDYRAAEGRIVKIPFRGNLNRTVQQITGGLRSACTYVGASCLKHLPKRTTFVRVSQQLNEAFKAFEVQDDLALIEETAVAQNDPLTILP